MKLLFVFQSLRGTTHVKSVLSRSMTSWGKYIRCQRLLTRSQLCENDNSNASINTINELHLTIYHLLYHHNQNRFSFNPIKLKRLLHLKINFMIQFSKKIINCVWNKRGYFKMKIVSRHILYSWKHLNIRKKWHLHQRIISKYHIWL